MPKKEQTRLRSIILTRRRGFEFLQTSYKYRPKPDERAGDSLVVVASTGMSPLREKPKFGSISGSGLGASLPNGFGVSAHLASLRIVFLAP